jgi:hypothetical protein
MAADDRRNVQHGRLLEDVDARAAHVRAEPVCGRLRGGVERRPARERGGPERAPQRVLDRVRAAHELAHGERAAPELLALPV